MRGAGVFDSIVLKINYNVMLAYIAVLLGSSVTSVYLVFIDA